ncbi:DEAD/DEAH box helicase [Candidatus Marsarchaeota archaeon]|nr:DEAD/DEAH box helicase [Candidatus Marsarchaeota archaeon]
MIIQELKGKIPEELIESASKRGISSLTPPQEMAVNAGLLKRKNIVIAAPTASGKTFIAELAMIKSIIWDRKKAIYVAPMRALVSEKFNDFKEAYPYLKAAISIGDLDSLDMWLEKYDMIFVSTEKLDSLIRHGIDWLSLIGTVVIDEVHMIDDAGRGPTLEILMAKLRRLAKDAQIVALSATIGNSAELASWLGAGLVESDFRPVTLEKGVELNGIVHYPEKEEKLLGSHKLPELRITQDTLEKEKQLIIFYSTRRNAESGAEKLSEVTESKSAKNSEDLKRISKEIINVLGRPTDQCEKLARLVSWGKSTGSHCGCKRHS